MEKRATSRYKVMVDDRHSKDLRGSLQSLWRQGFLTDYTVVVDGVQFHLHKVAVACMCDYFHAAFRSGMTEVRQDVHHLKNVPCRGFKEIVSFLYTGKLRLSQANVVDVVSAAAFLQCKAVMELCSKFLLSKLCLENYDEMSAVAVMYNIISLKRGIREYVLNNFAKFATSDFFKEFSVSEVSDVLKEDKLSCPSEHKLFCLTWDWIRHDIDNRIQNASQLLEHIRFPFMSNYELQHLRKHRLMAKSGQARQLLNEAAEFKAAPDTFLFRTNERTRIRSEEFLITFCYADSIMHSCVYYRDKWLMLNRALGHPKPFYNVGSVVVSNQLFICGGGHSDRISRACYSFSAITSRWSRLANLHTARRNFILVPMEGQLYALGGISGPDEPTAMVERYDIEQNSWTVLDAMPEALSSLAACPYSPGVIAVAAGMAEDGRQVKQFRLFRPHENKWETKADILHEKFRPKMFSVAGRLYLLDLSRTSGALAHFEQYNNASGQWTLSELPGVRFSRHFSAAVIGDWIYFVGKNDVDDGRSKRYNVVTKETADIVAYPYSVEAPVCSLMRMPKHILQNKMLKAEK